jgi:hypothetical protein
VAEDDIRAFVVLISTTQSRGGDFDENLVVLEIGARGLTFYDFALFGAFEDGEAGHYDGL